MSDIRDTENDEPSGIAIIGMSGRFPGAKNVKEFWNNLLGGKESIKTFSDDELLAHGADPEQLKDPSYVRSRTILDDPEYFDAEFFGFTNRDAELTDPQHRLFLESCWEALEDSGYANSGSGQASVGVYGGSSLNTYALNQVFGNGSNLREFTQGFQVDGYNILIGNDKDYLATRIAYKLDLRGPAITIQTACSTSLVAICQAAAGLEAYQCDMALAGGVSISFPQERGYVYQEGAIASKDGHCRPFDADAQGTVFGSGCGVLLLKRLEDAMADRDSIYAVIKGYATNNDGMDKVSYMAPSVNGQTDVIALAHGIADVSAESISYVEAHGTGTPLGDPIEVAGLTQAFGATTDKKQFCGLGAVKSNFGHLEAAAGVTGVIKTALALKNRVLPATLHYQAPNPKIDFEKTPFYVVSENKNWADCPLPRRAGVSSFGVGGTNAHVVLEEAPETETSPPSRKNQLFTFSARNEEALEDAVHRFKKALPELEAKQSFADAAFTLNRGRKVFDCRRALVASSVAEAMEIIEKGDPKRFPKQSKRFPDPQIVFMFPGQGAQYVNMGKELYETEQVFREIVDDCATLAQPELGLDIRSLLFPEQGEEKGARDELTRTVYTQPALFIVMFAQARLWMSWGVQPAAMVGHSAGEYVAAVLAGVMGLEDAIRIIATRARDMQSLTGGGMLSVRAGEESVVPLLFGSLAISGVNSRMATVVSGPYEELDELVPKLEAQKILSKPLHTSHAFHSPMMDPIVEPFREKVGRLALSKAKIPIVSSFTGDWIQADDWMDPSYWANQLRGTVRFADAVSTLAQDPSRILLEVGPGQTLSTLANSNSDRSKEQLCLPSMPPIENPDEQAAMLRVLGRLWLAGVHVDWDAFYSGEQRGRISLPTYPFQRKRYWVEASSDGEPAPGLGDSEANGRVEDVARGQLKQMMQQLDALEDAQSNR